MSDVTIAVVPRDRFSKTRATIDRLLEVTPGQFQLVVVDGGMPARYRGAVEKAVAGRRNTEILRSDHHIDPNGAKNWVIRETRDGEFLAFVENDVLVHRGWLDALIRACDEEDASVGRPMIFERKVLRTFPHFDQRFGAIDTVERPAGSGYRIRPRRKPLDSDIKAKRQRTEVLETHCLLFRRSALAAIGSFDERINTRQEVDLALQLYAAGIPIVFEPASEVTYLRPPPVFRDERDYFLKRWDYDKAVRSHALIEEKWKVEGLPSSVSFVRHRQNFVSYSRYAIYYLRQELGSYVRYDLGERLRYKAYQLASGLPAAVRDPLHRRLYG